MPFPGAGSNPARLMPGSFGRWTTKKDISSRRTYRAHGLGRQEVRRRFLMASPQCALYIVAIQCRYRFDQCGVIAGARELATRFDAGQRCNTSLAAGTNGKPGLPSATHQKSPHGRIFHTMIVNQEF